ncbi:MAG: carbohydrate kinase, partial [Clostridia bacterium]|nr:carbohydrate kinase [Clostridia bacterium]
MGSKLPIKFKKHSPLSTPHYDTLGIDIGTSACKVALFDLEGKVIAQSTKEYPVYYPAPGYVEQNPQEWWKGICDAVREAINTAKIDPKQIAGIGVDGQSWSAIPVDKEGNVLYNTPIWMDTRASEISRKVL